MEIELKTLLSILVVIATCLSDSAAAMNSSQLQALSMQRLAGDRSGACFAVAVIEEDVAVARACADPTNFDRIGPAYAFEIGSVTKTMTSALLAKLVVAGRASLNDPLSKWMPSGAVVPSFDGQQILLRHIVTHTSSLPALPPGVEIIDPTDPYASMSSEQLHQSLASIKLTRAPGSTFEYSNFAFMLLSDALARQAGISFDELLDREIFRPLAMNGAYIGAPKSGVIAAKGHLPGGTNALPWNFPSALAGVGGVRATLDDMVRYVQGHLGFRSSALDSALAFTRKRVDVSSEVPMGMGWMLIDLPGRIVQVHEGGTGGFSSFVAIDSDRRRGVVILSDTAMTSSGGLGTFGWHLLEPSAPLGKPAREAAAPLALLKALKGDYRLTNGIDMTLSIANGSLVVQVPGQPQLLLAYDDSGAFYPREVDAVLRPQRQPGGSYAFTWFQGGGALTAIRLNRSGSAQSSGPPVADLAAYGGEYALLPDFALKVFVNDGKLFIQGTGQPSLPVDPAGTDTFVNPAVGVEIRFERTKDGRIHALTLLQGGQTLRGERR